jgi:predicted methyltransferase
MKLIPLAFALLLGACAHKGHVSNHHKLKKIIHSEDRTASYKVRDVYRNPLETLEFFEVEPHMNVVEISPGGGWYSEILAPYLESKGKLTLAIFDDSSDVSYKVRLNKVIKEKFPNHTFTTFDAPNYSGSIAPEGSADRVLTFRNVHNWMKAGKLKEALNSFHKALKPGGILGIVEHRARTSKAQDPKAISGYVREDYLIKALEAAGFEFIAKSEVNANYLDNANHPDGVWSLPPSLRGKDKNRSKFLAIGESDRMTLKFKKL